MKTNIYFTYFLLISFILFFSITNFYWIKEYRFDQLLDIDEAGYLSYSMSLANALKWGGIKGWFSALANPVQFGPLVPIIASIFIFFADGSENAALLTNTFLCIFLFITISQIGLILSGKQAALLSTIFTASLFFIIIYSRAFSFTIASALFFALAVLAFIKCVSFTNRNWSIILGMALALLILSRTMTLAFLPAFFIVCLVNVFFGNESLTKNTYKNIAWSVFFFLLLALPWYVINFKGVFGYLLSYGYGKQASEYGSNLDIFSLGYLKNRLSDWGEEYGFIQYSILIIILFFNLLKTVKNLKYITFMKSTVFQLIILLFFSFMTLFSSKNTGSGFQVPLMGVLSTLLISCFFNLYVSCFCRVSGWFVVCTLYAVIFYSQFNINNCNLLGYNSNQETGLNPYAKFTFPYLGDKVLLDCRGTIHRYIDAIPSSCINCQRNLDFKDINFNKEIAVKWRLLSSDIANYIYKNDVNKHMISFGTRHMLMNSNTFEFELIKKNGEALPVTQIEPTIVSNTILGYTDWIKKAENNTSCYIIKSNKTSGEFTPYPNIELLNSALLSLDYTVKKSFNTPTEGQYFEIWAKDSNLCR